MARPQSHALKKANAAEEWGAAVGEYFVYAPLHRIPEYERAGWVDTGSLINTHHGEHAELMRWPFKTNPPDLRCLNCRPASV